MELDLEIDRTQTNSKRWQGRGETIALTIGDSDFRLPGSIYNALSSRLGEGVVGYDAVPESLMDLIIGRLHELYAWQVQPEWLVFLPGVVPGLNIAGESLPVVFTYLTEYCVAPLSSPVTPGGLRLIGLRKPLVPHWGGTSCTA